MLGGVSNPAPGDLDFNGWRDLQALFDAAKASGLFVVFRPGKIFVLVVRVDRS